MTLVSPQQSETSRDSLAGSGQDDPPSAEEGANLAHLSAWPADEPPMGGRLFRFPLGSNRQRLSPYVRSTAPSKARTLPAKVAPA
jgi:hypothetical protein